MAKNARTKAATAPKASAAELSALVESLYQAEVSLSASESARYTAFTAIVKAMDLSDLAQIESVQAGIHGTLDKVSPDGATIYCTMLSNCRKIECGGVLKKVAVPGRGRAALLAALDSVKCIRDLRKALAEAKPEGLKPAPKAPKPVGTSKTQTKGSITKVDAAPGTAAVSTREQAFKAAYDVLAFVEKQFLQPGSDADLIGQIDAVMAALRKAA